MSRKYYRKDTIKELEELKKKWERNGADMVWRITESIHWYNIELEEECVGYGEKIAFYRTGNYEEIIEFCRTHSNGYENIYGLGMIESELVDATDLYIEEKRKRRKEKRLIN